jgi:CBS domain-containing protein
MTPTTNPGKPPPRLTLQAETAADLMSPNPVSVRDDATVPEAVALLTDRGISAAPVIDAAGRPVGVLSRTDLLIHDREQTQRAAPVLEFYHRAELSAPEEELSREIPGAVGDRTRVRDLMTPVVFSTAVVAPAARVVEAMLGLKVHRLFVLDPGGVLVGVISAMDVLRRLE